MSSVATALRGRVVTPVEIIEDGLVVVAEGHIPWVGAAAEAERAGVLIALPMTLCYLPAFFLLGLAPMVISLGTSILSSH